MPAPLLQPQRLILPGLLMAAPVATGLAMAAANGGLPSWLTVAGSVLPPVGAFWFACLYHAEVRRVAEFVRRLGETPGSAPGQGKSDGEGEGIAHELMAAIAGLDRAGAARHARLAARLDLNEAILEASPDPLILIGAERRVRYANQAARALFGDRMAEGDLALSLRHPEIIGAVDGVLRGEGSRSVEVPQPGPVECIWLARVSPFRRPVSVDEATAAGDDRLALLTLHDITKIKRSEQQRADFVANASHELRTPLAQLIGFIETLRGPARDDADARERFLAIMHEQATRMSRLVDDLMSLSRIELDEHTRPTGRVDVVRNVGAAVAAFELKAAARRIRLRVVADHNLPPVAGDPDQIAQVIHNLIGNAIKYTREQTEVVVALGVSDGPPGTPPAGRRTPGKVPARMISIAVSDQGEGIERIHLPRLTERFYRVDPARSRALGGTGLGLAIVKHILNRHRGRLTIDSEVGKGSTFTAWLPASV